MLVVKSETEKKVKVGVSSIIVFITSVLLSLMFIALALGISRLITEPNIWSSTPFVFGMVSITFILYFWFFKERK